MIITKSKDNRRRTMRQKIDRKKKKLQEEIDRIERDKLAD